MIVECPFPMSLSLTFITLVTGSKQNKLWCSSLCSRLHSSAVVCLSVLSWLKYSPQHTQKFYSKIFLGRKMRMFIQNLGVFRPSLLWDITKSMSVVVYRLLHPWIWDRLALPKSRWRTVIHIAAEATNLIFWFIPFCLNYILQCV